MSKRSSDDFMWREWGFSLLFARSFFDRFSLYLTNHNTNWFAAIFLIVFSLTILVLFSDLHQNSYFCTRRAIFCAMGLLFRFFRYANNSVLCWTLGPIIISHWTEKKNDKTRWKNVWRYWQCSLFGNHILFNIHFVVCFTNNQCVMRTPFAYRAQTFMLNDNGAREINILQTWIQYTFTKSENIYVNTSLQTMDDA